MYKVAQMAKTYCIIRISRYDSIARRKEKKELSKAANQNDVNLMSLLL